VVAIILLPFCGGFTIRLSAESPVAELQKARSLWKAQNLSDYTMHVGFGGAFICCHALSFTVMDNKVVKVEDVTAVSVENGNQPNSQLLALNQVPKWYSTSYHFLPPHLTDYTIDQLFDFAEQKLSPVHPPQVIEWCGNFDVNQPPRFEAAFDERRGYLKSLLYTSCVPHYQIGFCLMCPVVTDCAVGMNISNLQPSE
jgi:hypothetical protein